MSTAARTDMLDRVLGQGASARAAAMPSGAHGAAESHSDAVPPLRVLILCDRFPFPLQNGQNLRIYNYVSRLRGACAFDLVCYGDAPPPPELSPLFGSIECFPMPTKHARTGLSRVRHAFSVTHMLLESDAVREHLERILEERNYDVVWVSGWAMIVNVPAGARHRVLADAVDDGVLEFWRELRRSRTPTRFLLMLKWLFMNYRFERHYFGPAAQCLFVSEVDAEMFQRVCPAARVAVVHNGVDAEQFRPGKGDVDAHHIVFEGKMNFAPNADGIVAFCHELLPAIREAVPDVRVTLVGMDPPPEVRALASPWVEVTGYVDDVRPYVDRAAVFICPLRKGAGIKNKVLQAWAMGKAVVATPASVGGLSARDGENILIRPFDRSFADAVIALLRDPVRAAALGKCARSTIEERYTWDRKAREIGTLLRSVASRAAEADHA